MPYTSDVVRSAIHAITTNAAKLQPKHIRRTSAGIVPITSHISKLLTLRPNEFISAFDFYYKVVTQLMIHNNAFVFLKYDDRGKLQALYRASFGIS
ncbi:MAG: phage portal protein [Bacillota bacterium]